MRARGQQTLEQQRAAGAMEVQQFELGRTETLMDAAAQRKVRATAERTKARQDLVAGVGEAAGGVAQTFIPGIDGSDSLMKQAIDNRKQGKDYAKIFGQMAKQNY